jgi:hypothetical protein
LFFYLEPKAVSEMTVDRTMTVEGETTAVEATTVVVQTIPRKRKKMKTINRNSHKHQAHKNL